MLSYKMKRPHLSGPNGGVSTSNAYGAEAGLVMMAKGGNAADAIVAAGLVACVVEPFHSSLGGDGFITYYDKAEGKVHAYDARGIAPAAAHRDMFLDENGDVVEEKQIYGGASPITPSYLRALDMLLKEHGSLTWAEVAAPAIRLAREGFRAGAMYVDCCHGIEAKYFKEHFPEFVETYLPGGEAPELGDLVTNPVLADCLEGIVEKGVEWFYTGPVADAMAAIMQKYGGVMTKEDIVNCPVRKVEPIRGSYRGYELASMAPPSSGGTHLVQALNILENFDLAAMGFLSADYIHVLAETQKMMYADRSVAMGDPRFVDMQLDKLTSKAYAKELAERIDMNCAAEPMPAEGIEATEKQRITNTLNSSCIDKFGNAAVMTQTIGNWWGSGLVVPGGGFCLNDEMADFSAKTGVMNSLGVAYGDANAIRAGASPLSSMSPTVVLKDGEVVIACGAAGGPRIIIEVLQMILNVLDHGMRMDRAVAAPLVCCLTKKQGVELEYGISPDTQKLLEAKGHLLQLCSPEEVLLGVPNGVEQHEGKLYVCEPSRMDGVGGVLTDVNEKAYYGYRYK